MIYTNPSDKMLLIAGPCSLESRELAFECAEVVGGLAKKYADSLTVVFKGSFDKANRTSLSSPRGTGIEMGLKILGEVREKFSLPVLTDVHEAWQCSEAARVCDALQIPAFLCRQTDLLVAAAATGKCVNVKKGQFLAPQDMVYVVEKLRAAGAKEIWQTDRGTSFGYNNLVVDMRAFPIMRGNACPVLMDATHATQLPSAASGVSGGERKFVKTLSRAAIAAGADGLFIETHPRPEKAISDSATQLPLGELEALVCECIKIRRLIGG